MRFGSVGDASHALPVYPEHEGNAVSQVKTARGGEGLGKDFCWRTASTGRKIGKGCRSCATGKGNQVKERVRPHARLERKRKHFLEGKQEGQKRPDMTLPDYDCLRRTQRVFSSFINCPG